MMLENKRKPSACVAACRSKQNMKRAFKGEREKTVGESKQNVCNSQTRQTPLSCQHFKSKQRLNLWETIEM